jgi:hypothetical protein
MKDTFAETIISVEDTKHGRHVCVDCSRYVVVKWNQSEEHTRCLNHRSVSCKQWIDPKLYVHPTKIIICGVFFSHPALALDLC